MTDPTRLTDPTEVLLRQVHPAHCAPDGSISTVAFSPSKGHQGMLSTMRGAVGASVAHQKWVSAGRESIGTFGVSVEEIDEITITLENGECRGLQALDDAAFIQVEDHASIDFTSMPSNAKVRQAARKVREAAAKRGILYPQD